eukprot:50403-Rhodomonas_salina.2
MFRSFGGHATSHGAADASSVRDIVKHARPLAIARVLPQVLVPVRSALTRFCLWRPARGSIARQGDHADGRNDSGSWYESVAEHERLRDEVSPGRLTAAGAGSTRGTWEAGSVVAHVRTAAHFGINRVGLGLALNALLQVNRRVHLEKAWRALAQDVDAVHQLPHFSLTHLPDVRRWECHTSHICRDACIKNLGGKARSHTTAANQSFRGLHLIGTAKDRELDGGCFGTPCCRFH